METISEQEQKKNKVIQVTTVPIPYGLTELKANLAVNTNTPIKNSIKKIFNQAIKFHIEGNISQAEKYYQYCINKDFNNHIVFSNYGMLLKDIGKLKEAEISIRKAIELKPDYANAYSNLGNILSDLGNLTEAELFSRKAIELKPDFTEAHLNLGSILKSLGQLEEAELSVRKAIELQADLAEAHSNLGSILMDLDRLKEAEISVSKGIKLNPNLAICYRNLSLLLYAKGNMTLALKNIEKAFSIDPTSKDNQLLISVFKDKKRKECQNIFPPIDKQINNKKSFSFPVILNRPVEAELINSLYKIKALDLNKYKDPSFGNAKGSDYNLFDDNEKITEELEKDLTSIVKEVVCSDVFFRDSFFTILSGNSTIVKHNHIGSIDRFAGMDLWKKKYALVYYISIGNQESKHPGILKFYKDKNFIHSNKEILPSEGMIVIFPANRYHSVKYDGNKDRIIIGVNFYSI